jgi:hypothetical protein
MFADLRPSVVAVLAAAMLGGRVLLPLAKGMPFVRGGQVASFMLGLGVVLAACAIAWWTRILLDALVQHLLVLHRCGRCGHPAPDRGLRIADHTPLACRTWRCTECGSEWVGAGAFPDAETRRDAA